MIAVYTIILVHRLDIVHTSATWAARKSTDDATERMGAPPYVQCSAAPAREVVWLGGACVRAAVRARYDRACLGLATRPPAAGTGHDTTAVQRPTRNSVAAAQRRLMHLQS
jgi:hypothetical protein